MSQNPEAIRKGTDKFDNIQIKTFCLAEKTRNKINTDRVVGKIICSTLSLCSFVKPVTFKELLKEMRDRTQNQVKWEKDMKN